MSLCRSFALILLFLYLYPLSSLAQGNTKRFNEANQLFQQKRYDEVLSYLQVGKKFFKTESPEITFLSAASHYYKNKLDEAEIEFVSLLKNKNSLQVEALLFLGQIRFHRQDFTTASSYLKSYLKGISPSHPNRNEVRNIIRHCATGLAIQYRNPLAVVENLGGQVNTQGDEFAPVLNPLYQNRIYFTAANLTEGKEELPQTDIYYCAKDDGVWEKPKSFSPILNSPNHEVCIGFNPSGQVLYYFRGNNLLQGAIFTDTIRKSGKFKINPFYQTFDRVSAQAPPHFISDTLIIFASNTLGGKGGYDLFKISKRNGLWSKPENMGADVNSVYDENYPFLAPDGLTLYFSSNNPEISLGGFDIFKISLNSAQMPENMGTPINSTADDTHFSAARDGVTAYFASNRKSGYGARDLYTAYFFAPLSEMKPQTFTAGIAYKEDQKVDYFEFNAMVLNGAEHPLESGNKPYFNAVIPVLNENDGLKLFISAYPHKDLDFGAGVKNSLFTLVDIHRFFSQSSLKYPNISYRVICSPLFDKGNQGISFRFSGAKPMDMALNTNLLFDGENGNIAQDALCFKWLLKEIPYTDIQNINIEDIKGQENLLFEILPDKNKIGIYSGLFNSFELAQWSNNKNYEIVAFLDGEKLSKEQASKLISTYPVLSDYIK